MKEIEVTDHQKLLEALEGSRDLDAMIAVAVWPKMAEYAPDPQRGVGHWISPEDGPVYAEYYTTSIDAALMLVPEGWSLASLYDASDPKHRPWSGCILRRDEPYKVMKALGAKTRALAICAAAWRARREG